MTLGRYYQRCLAMQPARSATVQYETGTNLSASYDTALARPERLGFISAPRCADHPLDWRGFLVWHDTTSSPMQQRLSPSISRSCGHRAQFDGTGFAAVRTVDLSPRVPARPRHTV